MAGEEDKKVDDGGDAFDKEYDNNNFSVEDEVNFTDEKDDKTGKEKDDKITDDKDDKKDEPTLKQLMEKITGLEAKNVELDKAAKRAFYDIRKDKKELKIEPKKEGEDLSDADIKAILAAHKDDPEVMFNALVYKAEKIAKGGVKSAVDEVEIKGKAEKLNGVLKARLGEAYDDPTSDARKTIDNAKQILNLGDNPYGDFLAYAASVADALPTILKTYYEKGKNEGLGKSADDNRLNDIEDKKLGNGKGKGNGESKNQLTDSQMETARLLGFTNNAAKMKTYREQIFRRAKA
jgi:hypothetical protein